MGISISAKMLLHASVLALAAAGRINEIRLANSVEQPFCIGCSMAENGQFPWQASLQTTSHFCGASIISATFLNCAAHCKKNALTANVGDVDSTKGQRVSMKSGGYYAHPQYNGNLIINDFAVIEMAGEFNFNEYVQPIKLCDPSSERPEDRAPLM